MKIRAKIVGATGYGGLGIIELLLQHPNAEIVALIAREDAGKRIDELYPHLAGFCSLPILEADDPRANVDCDVVFLSTPDRVGMSMARDYLAKGIKVIDYSGDFRFTTPEAYADYATRLGKEPTHADPELLGQNAYGLVELHREEIAKTSLVGNPGCFACSCILGLSPAVHAGIVDPIGLICDCKTGVSGAGKKLAAAHHFPHRYENVNAYRLSGHQHVCEIERELGLQANADCRITFTAHVVPVCRGILSTLYGTLTKDISEEDVIAIYKEFFKDSPFVRIYPSNAAVGTQQVRGTNFCNLVVSVDKRCRRLRIVSHIDNLVKGQAGSALQNMNVMFGLPETCGLIRPPQFP